ncbi:MAG: rod shape-determining protein MreC [Bacteroidetes bacterium]|nr:rod shape-determining protein MreC [Bacteroidota bacterium]
MKNLFKLIAKFHFTIIFVLIEFFSLFLVVKYNVYQRSTFLSSANLVSGYFNSVTSSITGYLSLKTINDELSQENAKLKNSLRSAYKSNKISFLEIHDSVFSQQYIYLPAKVIRNTVHRKHNYITIDKGSKHGIRSEMGVVAPGGVVGIVKDVSYSFASVISLLNSRLMISGKLKKNGYFGVIQWEGGDYRKAKLNDIPFHVKIMAGDSVVTSGYSAVFPEGIMIGRVVDFIQPEGESFYDITIGLSTDFKNLQHVHVVGNLMKDEQKRLEPEIGND